MATEPYRFKDGKVIPADHFENEPRAPKPLEESMPAEEVAAFRAKTAELKRKLKPKP